MHLSAWLLKLVPDATHLITRVDGHGNASAALRDEIQAGIKNSPMLVALMFSVTACAPNEFEQFEAIKELEQHCGLPDNILADAYMRAQRASVSRTINKTGRSGNEYLLYLGGDISDQRILDERDCIKSFKSKDGFRFNFHAISPTEI